jgi:hypothetical protein
LTDSAGDEQCSEINDNRLNTGPNIELDYFSRFTGDQGSGKLAIDNPCGMSLGSGSYESGLGKSQLPETLSF